MPNKTRIERQYTVNRPPRAAWPSPYRLHSLERCPDNFTRISGPMSNAVVAEAVHFEQGELVFLSPVAFVAGYLEPLVLELSDGTTRDVRVQMKTCRSLGDGRFLGVGTVVDGLDPTEKLPDPGEGVDAQRQATRVPYKTGVASPALPNFKAMTLDCSLSGLQLQSDGPLPVGQVLLLSLNLSDSGPPVPCQARVAWCRHHEADGKYRAGLEFVQPVVEMELALRQAERTANEPEAPPSAETGSLQGQLSHIPTVRTHPPGEKLTPLPGVIQHCEMQDRTLKVEVQLVSGQMHTVTILHTRTMRDLRDQNGSEISDLGYTETLGGARYRFLTPKRETVLDVEAAPRSEVTRGAGRKVSLS